MFSPRLNCFLINFFKITIVKKLMLLLVLLTLIAGTIYSQNIKIPAIGSKAPSFTANSTSGEITFPNQFGDSWKIW